MIPNEFISVVDRDIDRNFLAHAAAASADVFADVV
jgi:hypothetical protein